MGTTRGEVESARSDGFCTFSKKKKSHIKHWIENRALEMKQRIKGILLSSCSVPRIILLGCLHGILGTVNWLFLFFFFSFFHQCARVCLQHKKLFCCYCCFSLHKNRIIWFMLGMFLQDPRRIYCDWKISRILKAKISKRAGKYRKSH